MQPWRTYRKLDQFGLYTFLSYFVQHCVQENGGISVLSGAAVECHDLHFKPPHMKGDLYPMNLNNPATEKQ
jgi:hypothetical protein